MLNPTYNVVQVPKHVKMIQHFFLSAIEFALIKWSFSEQFLMQLT